MKEKSDHIVNDNAKKITSIWQWYVRQTKYVYVYTKREEKRTKNVSRAYLIYDVNKILASRRVDE